MIIKLNNADFSQNNIGRLTERSLLPEIIELLSNFSKPLTDSQKFSVQDFILGLKNNGIWSLIGNLYMPIIAGNNNECGINVKTKQNDVIFSSEDYTLVNEGLKLTPTTTSYWNTSAKITFNGSQQNLHLGAFNTTSLAELTQTDAIFGMNDNNAIVQLGIGVNGAVSTKTDNNTNINVGTYARTGFADSSLKLLVQSTLGNFAMFNGEAGLYGTPISTDNTYTNKKVNVFNIASVWRRTIGTYGLLTIGSAMSREQAEIYNSLCVELVNSLLDVN